MGLHNDITRYIYEFEYREHQIKIVERKMRYKNPFLWLYILKNDNNTYIGQDVKEKEMKDLEAVTIKIKKLIDDDISLREKYAEEVESEKKKVNWTGQSFKRGDYVHFKGNDKYKALNTYVWTFFAHMDSIFYLIAHPDGQDRNNWMAKYPFKDADGFECVHSSQLKEGLKYIQIDCHETFTGETDQLVLLKRT